MRAVRQTAVGGPEVLELAELPEPEPGPGQLLLRNRAVALNFHDVIARRQAPDAPLPYVPGTDVAGEVEAVGPGVEGFAPGDRVVAIHLHGGYAEKTAVLAGLATRIPEGVSFEQAAACPVAGLTAHFLCEDLRVGRGTTALVHAAAGSVGCFLGALLRDRGASSIGLVSSAEKAEVARAAGHPRTVNRREEDVAKRVSELTEGRGVDVVYDSVAGPDFARSFACCAPEGSVVLFGRAAGEPPEAALREPFLDARRNLGLRTYFLGTTLMGRPERLPAAWRELFEGFAAGRIALPIERLPLAEAAEAHARLEAGGTVGKLLLVP